MPKSKSRLSSTNSRSAKAVLAVLLATMLSAGSAYANPDQPPTDPSGGTATDSDDAGLSGSAVNGTINLPRTGSIGDGAFDNPVLPPNGGKAGAGPVCTRHAEAITSATDSLAAIQGQGDLLLARQDAIDKALFGAVQASDPDPADIASIAAEIASNNSAVRAMAQDIAETQAELTRALAGNAG